MTPLLDKNWPPSSNYLCSKSERILEKLFLARLSHFASFYNVSVDKNLLLILDNHSYHCTLDAYEFCKNLDKITLSLFNKASSVVATVETATSGFVATRIYSLNPNIFTEEDFIVEKMLQTCDYIPVCVNSAHSSENITEAGC
ncbi:hypothetical protein PR048_008683 [Dryococelus australis]|uniref:DDE-1 domain-containing protein n=1 Tax=Dryococelus australis TaxID=614101 RepID=A0ABQ9HXT5_9NEOP|nr:hypothetical protein PR048_008683 [Dryococelus australis]